MIVYLDTLVETLFHYNAKRKSNQIVTPRVYVCNMTKVKTSFNSICSTVISKWIIMTPFHLIEDVS